MKHYSRHNAEKRVEIARRELRLAEKAVENGADESVFLDADAEWKSAIKALVAAEMTHPTHRETVRRESRIRLENRGLMA